jgi:hypothetical protein
MNDLICEMVSNARAEAGNRFPRLPDAAETPGQRLLEQAHGTPRSFAVRCVAAIGEISVDEAEHAVETYYQSWRDS